MRIRLFARSAGALALCLCLAMFLAVGTASADTPADGQPVTDPVGNYCHTGGNRAGLFDCDCVASTAGEVRARLSETSAERHSSRIESSYRQIEKLQAMAEQKPELAEAYERKIATERKKIEMLSNPDPMSFGNGIVMKQFDEMPVCRSYEGTYQKTLEGCMTTASRDEGEAYCACVAGKVADAWTGGELIASSNLKSERVRARMACTG